MIRFILLVTWLISIYIPVHIVKAQESEPTGTPAQVSIQSPLPGQALQGEVQIQGNIAIEGFQSARLEFSYANTSTDTWFVIQSNVEPNEDSTLAFWDTTTITDGVYNLRLSVTIENGEQWAVTISRVRVRNYTPIETDTPTPITPTSTPIPGDTPIPTITPTPTGTPVPPTRTPLPTNPNQLSTRDINVSLGKGALSIIGIFALAGLVQMLQSAKRAR